jgi:5'-methylthioadenosine phosphorylase
MKKARIGIIGGTGITAFITDGEPIRIGTPFGPSPLITIGDFGGKEVACLPRHGEKHTVPPHKINYQANVWALHNLGVERILGTNAVGAINIKYQEGDLVIPSDFIDFTKSRAQTFFNDAPVTHIDVSTPYCPELSDLLRGAAQKHNAVIWDNAVYLCTEGPRYETPAEIRMFRRLGCDIAGMTAIPELILARELEMCYSSLCFVTNMAAGLQDKLTAELIAEGSRRQTQRLSNVLEEAVRQVSWKKQCSCARSLEGTRV